MTTQAPEVPLLDLRFARYPQLEEFALQRCRVALYGLAMGNETPPVYFAQDSCESVFDKRRKPGVTPCVTGYAGAVRAGAGQKTAPSVAVFESGYGYECPSDCEGDGYLMALP